MKHGKKPTVAQRKLIDKKGLIAENWLVVKDTPKEMVVVHRYSIGNATRVIQKEDKHEST